VKGITDDNNEYEARIALRQETTNGVAWQLDSRVALPNGTKFALAPMLLLLFTGHDPSSIRVARNGLVDFCHREL
jgi:hypothetical protein